MAVFNIPAVQYEGAKSSNEFAFKFYDAERVILGKPMSEWLPFAMAWWHNLGAAGTDMFGANTADKSFGADASDALAHAKAKADAGFEFMQKLGIKYFCFHDADLITERSDLAEQNAALDAIADYICEKIAQTGIKALWGTANLFSNPRFMNGAGSANSPDVFARAAANVKKSIDLTIRFGGRGFVFWGGREGYETLWNTDMKFEQENIASLMKLAVQYARGKGFSGDFYIEPKPKEPMKHQYDFDAATAIGFLRQYGLDKDFKMNIEANHATLAGHTFRHELRVSAINGMLGSIDANIGDTLLGWDTDEFPYDVYDAAQAMYEVINAGGLTGGFNFDAKNRRPSNTYEDMFRGFILGMDTFALGLIKAAALIEDGRIGEFVKSRYSGYNGGIGAKIRSGAVTLEELNDYALSQGEPPAPESGKQEWIEGIVNQIMFGG
jgi:xylose isomerase